MSCNTPRAISSLSARESRLLKKWEEIEALEDDEDNVSEREFTRCKESWFGQAYTFLQDLPENEHCWCGHYDITWPLLELFYYYFTDSENNSSSKILWQRLSSEMRKCTECVLQYYKAKEMYATDFLEEVVCSLLAVLRSLDEGRVSKHLHEILCKMRNNSLNSENDCGELTCVLFEVMRFPMLLDDAEIDKLFATFLQYVENTYELTLATDQFYPGVYALLFHTDQATRGIALRLATSFGKLRVASDLEPIQPLLAKHMQCLEFDLFEENKSFMEEATRNKDAISAVMNSRPRARFTKESLWIGLKTLLGVLEPAAFEEAIIERYPSLLSLVLNHASEATPVFWNALFCLKLLLEVLGYKLWIKTTFSPEVMRSTLIGQCFHTCEEKMHKAIFDLFQPFLQSLEALQDGEYERQRRNVLYFLLQQVSHSRNFSGLMRKKARQIAFLIVTRGYKMAPASPPLECVHVWGPPLLESVKDTQLYDAVRQPAIHLLEIIIVADSVVLASLDSRDTKISDNFIEINDEDVDDLNKRIETMFENNRLREYKGLDKLTEERDNWLCAPILWVEILGKVLPSELPDSFSLAVAWASARMFLVSSANPNLSGNCFPDRYPEVTSSKALSSSLIWETPKGCDDGADGQLVPNAVKVSSHGSQLVLLLKRCTDTYMSHLKQCNIVEKWIWNPLFAEALVLLSLSSNENIKDCGRYVLGHFARDSGLDAGLVFLYAAEASATCVNSGLLYATRMLMLTRLDGGPLQNILFLAWKLVTLWTKAESADRVANVSTPNKEGGFLKELKYDQLSKVENTGVSSMGISSRRKFQHELSTFLWPLLLKLMRDGRHYSEDNTYLMSFARTFDLLPVVFQNVLHLAKRPAEGLLSRCYGDLQGIYSIGTKSWIVHFISWGEVSVASIHRRWKEALVSILNHMKEVCSLPESQSHLFEEIQSWLMRGTILRDSMRSKIESLFHTMLSAIRKVEVPLDVIDSVSVGEGKHINDEGIIKQTIEEDVIVLHTIESKPFPVHNPSESIGSARKMPEITDDELANSVQTLPEYEIPQRPRHLHPVSMQKQLGVFGSSQSSKNTTLDRYFGISGRNNLAMNLKGENRSTSHTDKFNIPQNTMEKIVERNIFPGKMDDPKHSFGNKPVQDKQNATKTLPRKLDDNKQPDKKPGQNLENKKEPNNADITRKCEKTESMDSVLKEIVEDESNSALKSSVTVPYTKSVPVFPKKGLSIGSISQPKRQLIQLQVPNEHLKNNGRRPGLTIRPPPPRMDEWYKRILCLDYFAVVGLSSEITAEGLQAEAMLKVPLTFRSSQHYMDIFRPLVLEEFKAQLQQSYDQMSLSDGMTTCVLRLMSLEKVDDFDVGRFTADAGADAPARACFENDLLLLSRQPFDDSSQAVHMIGKVERQEKDNNNHSVKLVLKFFLRTGNKRLVKVRSLLLERSKWHATRLMSITPQLREFQALSALEHLPLMPIILNNRSSVISNSEISALNTQALARLSDKLQIKLKADYNASQIQAIEMALQSTVSANGHELSLVQGPPGTGKTRTIVAIVSALFASIRNSKGNKINAKEDSSLKTSHTSANRNVSRNVAIARSWQAAALAREQVNQETSESVPRDRDVKARILVCAQSNAAVDELVGRIRKNGLYDSSGGFFRPYLVRVGNAKTVHPNSLPVFIDTLIDKQLESEKENTDAGGLEMEMSKTGLLRSKLHKILDNIKMLEAQLSKLQNSDTKGKKGVDHNDTEASIKTNVNLLYKQRRQVCGELAILEAGEKQLAEEARNKRQSLKKEIIRQAEIVIATLSGCGGDVFSACLDKACGGRRQPRNLEEGLFDAVVIDEAAQALEPATLIPLQLLKQMQAKCVMVGDPKQLPATVLSQMASRFSYQCSMFERLQKGGHLVSMLNVQYRMHPDICEFPSRHFYGNQLQNGLTMEVSRKAAFHGDKYLGPYVVFDVVDGHERVKHGSSTQSLCNEAEVNAALDIFKNLKARYPDEVFPGRIGVITPYQQQLSLLRESFCQVLGKTVAEGIEFNTVDAFQGREVDIVIFSTVRATARNTPGSSRIGFVADIRRMNVALTRARFSLWIICNALTLQESAPWAALLDDAKERGNLHAIKRPYTNFFKVPQCREWRDLSGNKGRSSLYLDKTSHVDKVPWKRPELEQQFDGGTKLDHSDTLRVKDISSETNKRIQSQKMGNEILGQFEMEIEHEKTLNDQNKDCLDVYKKDAADRKLVEAQSKYETKKKSERFGSPTEGRSGGKAKDGNCHSSSIMRKRKQIDNDHSKRLNKNMHETAMTDSKLATENGILQSAPKEERSLKEGSAKDPSIQLSLVSDSCTSSKSYRQLSSHHQTEIYNNNGNLSNNRITSNCSVQDTRAEESESDFETLRHPKRHHRENDPGEVGPVNSQKAVPRHETSKNISYRTSGLKNLEKKIVSEVCSRNEFLDAEWERFQRVLAETKILFPLINCPEVGDLNTKNS